jgi:hypothetical protein
MKHDEHLLEMVAAVLDDLMLMELKKSVVEDKHLLAVFINTPPLIVCVASSVRRRYLSIFCLIGVLTWLFGRR